MSPRSYDSLSCLNSVSCLGSDAAALLPACVAQIRLYARPDAIASGAGDYALHITKRLLGFYQDYFKVQYSLPKLGKLSRGVFSDATREVGGNNFLFLGRLCVLNVVVGSVSSCVRLTL